jgi:putative ABC transport system permease protein
MLKNYFKIAIRQLRKQKMYSAIKIGGFALSIAACLLIALFISDELSYDKSYPDAKRIFRVTGEYNNNGKVETGADWPAPLAKALKEDFPEVEKSGRLMPHELFYGAGSNEIRRQDKRENNYENKFSYADQDILDILKIPMVYGDRAHALAEPNTMVISKRKADKYFPGQNPVGKLMILNDDKNKVYKINGVMQDFPTTSHIQYDFLLTMAGYELWNGEQVQWSASNYPTYILLKPGADAAQLQRKLKLILEKYYLPMLKASGNKEASEFTQKARLLLQPISDIHLKSYDIDDGLEKSDMRFVWLFGAIACFILIIACINFINLSTAKSANRAKEVGLRKVVGSYRSSLVKQFLTESLLFSVLSFVLGMLLAALVLPYFNILSAKSLTIPWNAWWLIPLMIGASVVVGIFAGLYPSFYLSSFKPIDVLKGQVSRGTKNSILRNGLVVFQFTTSIILIIGTLVIYRQTHYILNTKVGFDKDQVMLIQGTNTLGDKTKNFKDELLKVSQIKAVSISDYLPVSGTKRDGNTFNREGRTKEDIGVSSQKWRVDYDYIKTMGMKIAEGRDFSKDMASDSAAVIVNKTMAEKLGLKKPLGELITNGWEHFRIIGVMEDFNFESMKQSIAPLCLVLGNNRSTLLAVKMNAADAKNTIASVTAIWKNFSPSQPIRFSFLDESFANMYADVQRMGSIFTSFAVLAIIIACLGLFALSAFMAEQRNKEIGIRKVLGASVSSITSMLSKDFIKLVIIAIVIASPVAWWVMTKWLQDFAYKIAISWWMIAIAGLIAVAIALITVSFQSVKAALMNPVKSLRSE